MASVKSPTVNTSNASPRDGAARSGQSGLADQAERPEAEHHCRTIMSPLVTGEMADRIQDVDPGV